MMLSVESFEDAKLAGELNKWLAKRHRWEGRMRIMRAYSDINPKDMRYALSRMRCGEGIRVLIVSVQSMSRFPDRETSSVLCVLCLSV
jgi:hypothetical protein